jgi:hypothetical protein
MSKENMTLEEFNHFLLQLSKSKVGIRRKIVFLHKFLKEVGFLDEEAKDKLIEVLMNQVEDLTMMSKIELGDDVIEEINRLKEIINQNKDE